jgi:hypothetical protein
VTLAWATPESINVPAAVTVIRADKRPMPVFLFNAGPPQQIRHRRRSALPGAPRGGSVRDDNDVMTSPLMLIRRYVCVKVENRTVSTEVFARFCA